jgi:ketopantoate reductase
MGQLVRAQRIDLTDESVLPVAALCEGSEEQAVETLMALGGQYKLKAPRHRMSTLQDLEAGRPLEIHETLGFALRKAGQYGISMPLVDNFYQLISAIDRIRAAST